VFLYPKQWSFLWIAETQVLLPFGLLSGHSLTFSYIPPSLTAKTLSLLATYRRNRHCLETDMDPLRFVKGPESEEWDIFGFPWSSSSKVLAEFSGWKGLRTSLKMSIQKGSAVLLSSNKQFSVASCCKIFSESIYISHTERVSAVKKHDYVTAL